MGDSGQEGQERKYDYLQIFKGLPEEGRSPVLSPQEDTGRQGSAFYLQKALSGPVLARRFPK